MAGVQDLVEANRMIVMKRVSMGIGLSCGSRQSASRCSHLQGKPFATRIAHAGGRWTLVNCIEGFR